MIIIAVWLCLVALSQSFCDNTHVFDDPTNYCSFTYNYTETSCSTFKLVECRYSYCVYSGKYGCLRL